MAFWNAPLDDRTATPPTPCEAALAHARGAGDELNAGWDGGRRGAGDRAASIQPVQVRRSGSTPALACVGNLGSLRRFDYSVIGDEVNVASRLESASKMFGVDIVASEATRREAPDYAWLEVDAVVFKNKTRPIGVHALIGDAAYARSEPFQRLEGAHRRMMERYRQRDIATARELATELRRDAPEIARGLYGFHLRRFDAIDPRSLGESWRAMTVLDEK